MRRKSSLRAVLMLFRHGDRPPVNTYPNDPYANYNWSVRLGELTTIGAEQIIQSAKDKATRYRFLIEELDGNVDLRKLCILSSHVRRCVDSVTHFLNGFLKTSWPDNIIYVIPREEDKYLAPYGKLQDSERRRDLFRKHHRSLEKYFKTPQAYQDFTEYIKKNSGWEMDTFELFQLLDDTLTIQLRNGLKLPEWTDSIYEEYIKPIGQFAYYQIASYAYMQNRSGALLKDMIDRLEQISQQNIVLYSAHDITLSALMIRMGVLDEISPKPNYGSMFAVELHENPATEDGLEVKLFYFINYADQNPTEMKIPNCEIPCSFRQFKEIMNSKDDIK